MTASLTRTISPDESEVRFLLAGRISSHLHAEFCEAYRSGPGPGATYIIDLTHVEAIDDSALGIFFQLREYAGGDRAKIHFVGANAQVTQALKLGNFHEIFVVQESAKHP
jgi:anti-anti-sigma regulatory factor